MLLGNVESLRMEQKDNDCYELSVLLALCSQEVPEVFTPSLSFENPNLSTQASKVMQKGAARMVTVGIDSVSLFCTYLC